jgi:hypothetical protein
MVYGDNGASRESSELASGRPDSTPLPDRHLPHHGEHALEGIARHLPDGQNGRLTETQNGIGRAHHEHFLENTILRNSDAEQHSYEADIDRSAVRLPTPPKFENKSAALIASNSEIRELSDTSSARLRRLLRNCLATDVPE